MSDAEKHDEDDAGGNLFLNGDDGEDGSDEAKRARPGQDSVGKSEDKCSQNPLHLQLGHPPARHRAFDDTQHVQADPKEYEAYHKGPIRTDVTEHSSKQRANNPNGRDGEKQSGCEENCVNRCLTSLNYLVLPRDIPDDKRNGCQMAGAEEYADHPPKEASQRTEQHPACHPLIDEDKYLIHTKLFDAKFGQLRNDPFFIQKANVPILLFTVCIVEYLRRYCTNAILGPFLPMLPHVNKCDYGSSFIFF